MTAYYFPPAAKTGKSQALTLWGSSLFFPSFTQNSLYAFDGTSVTTVSDSTKPAYGATAAAAFDADALWTDWKESVGSVASGTIEATKPIYPNGIAVSGSPYISTWSGDFYSVSGTALVSGAGVITSGSVGLQEVNGNLYSLIAPENEIAIYSVASSSATYTAPTITNLLQTTNFAANATSVALLGTQETPLRAYGANNVAVARGGEFAAFADPQNNTMYLLQGPDPDWKFINSLAASGTADWCAWNDLSTQILVTDTSAADLVVYGVAASALSVAQTLSLPVSGATQIVASPLQSTAMYVNPTANSVEILTYSGGSWATSQAISLTAPNALFATSSTQVGVCVSGGYTRLNYANATWSADQVTSLPYTPTSLYMEGEVLYLCGTSGSTGNITVVSGSVTVSGAWSGSADAIFEQQGQIVVVDQTSSLLRYFSYFGALQTQGTQALPAAWDTFTSAGTSLFATTPTSLYQYHFKQPFKIAPIPFGWAAIHTTSWGTPYSFSTAFGIPTCAAWKSDGSLRIATTANELYTIVSGTATSATILNYDGDATNEPVGISDMTWYNGHLYGVTSLNSALVELE